MRRPALATLIGILAFAGVTAAVLAADEGLRCDVHPVDTGNASHVDAKLAFELVSSRDGLTVFQSWNSWGYYARYFLAYVRSDDQTTYVIQKRSGEWTKNFPSRDVINRGQRLITIVDLCDGTWYVSPKWQNPSHETIVIVPQFRMERANDEPPMSRMEYTPSMIPVWTGQIAGPPIDVTLSQQCADGLNVERP